nr:MAG TPA: Nucleotide modification associated domain 1 [Caudoviricetes sp.]
MNNHTETQEKIIAITGAMQDLLLYKNQKYGDSALSPKHIFYKGDAVNSILIRLDDKLGRITASHVPLINDVADIIGYCTLLLIGMGVKPEDIKKLMD